MVFGRLTVIDRAGSHPKRGCIMWRCVCECGRETIVNGVLLRDGTTKGCGCSVGKSNITHGHSYSITYSSWKAMLKRCRYKKHQAFKNYGGRGIKVCNRWQTSFQAFLEDMGERPSKKMCIDRINNDGDYEPGNCRWASMKEQQRNRRGNVRITFQDETMTEAEWARKIGISQTALKRRLDMGWDIADALTRPAQKGIKYQKQTLA